MEENKDYLGLRDDIEVPWDELRSERTLKKILEATTPYGEANDPIAQEQAEGDKSSTRRPWLFVAAAALVLGSVGVTAAMMKGGDTSEVQTMPAPAAFAQADTQAPEIVVPDAATPEPKPAKSFLADPEAGSLLAFAEGAEARLGNNASVRVLSDSPSEIRLGQEGGEVVYSVDKAASEKRDVVVQVAHLYIIVQGSNFSAALSESKVSIAVDEGQVLIDDGHQKLALVGGDSLRLERQARLDEAEISSKPGVRRAKAVHAAGQKRESQGVSVKDLMKRADDARQAGDLAASAAALQQIVDGQAEGKTPPVTWMSLGRVERRRGNHQESAKAFESYWKRHSSRPLAEDALHEAFVSWKAAGHTSEAQRVAQEYLDAFPGGLHADQMATYLP